MRNKIIKYTVIFILLTLLCTYIAIYLPEPFNKILSSIPILLVFIFLFIHIIITMYNRKNNIENKNPGCSYQIIVNPTVEKPFNETIIDNLAFDIAERLVRL